MRLHATRNTIVRIAVLALLSVLLVEMIPDVFLFANQANAPLSLEKAKSMAEAQHEIVVLLIQKREFEKALSEANKIFDLNWPDDQEPLLVKELRNLADQFLRFSQTPLGLKLIERNFSHFKNPSSQAALQKEMGYLYKSLNQIDKSIDCFKKARDLEGGK
jgi:tetratricopeptide (TPR) repeat protein